MPRESGASSLPEASRLELRRLWNTGSSAFADDDIGEGGPRRPPRSHRPAALDDVGGALSEEVERHGAAELARAVGGARPRRLEDNTAGQIQHRGGKRHLGAADLGKACDRRIAVAV